MSVTNITSQTNGSSSDSHAKANPGDSAVLVNYLPSEHVATGLEYNSLIRFVTSKSELQAMTLNGLSDSMYEINKKIAESLHDIIVGVGDDSTAYSMDHYITSGRSDRFGHDYVFGGPDLRTAEHMRGNKTDVWATRGKRQMPLEITSDASIAWYEDPDWTIQPVIGTSGSSSAMEPAPELGLRVRYKGPDPHMARQFKSKAQNWASTVLASQKWRDVASTVGDASSMVTLSDAAEALKQLDSAVSEIQSDLMSKDRSEAQDKCITFFKGAVAGATVATLARSVYNAVQARRQ